MSSKKSSSTVKQPDQAIHRLKSPTDTVRFLLFERRTTLRLVHQQLVVFVDVYIYLIRIYLPRVELFRAEYATFLSLRLSSSSISNQRRGKKNEKAI